MNKLPVPHKSELDVKMTELIRLYGVEAVINAIAKYLLSLKNPEAYILKLYIALRRMLREYRRR